MNDKDTKRLKRIKALMEVTSVPLWHLSGSTTERFSYGTPENRMQILDLVDAVPWLIELLEQAPTPTAPAHTDGEGEGDGDERS